MRKILKLDEVEENETGKIVQGLQRLREHICDKTQHFLLSKFTQ